MRTYYLLLAFALLSFGCGTAREKTVSLNLNPEEQIISQRLQQEPIPLPKTTPFDSDARKQEAYFSGFRKAWNFVISGNFLHGTMGVSIPDGLEEPWNAGWNDGYKIASDHWLQEFAKWRRESVSVSDYDSSP